MAGKGGFHRAPSGGMIGEKLGNLAAEGLGRCGKSTAANGFEQAEIPFFLAGHQMVDEHRATGGDRFMHGGSSGFANHQVMAGEELRNFARPPDDADPVGIGVLDIPGSRIQAADIAPEHDG